MDNFLHSFHHLGNPLAPQVHLHACWISKGGYTWIRAPGKEETGLGGEDQSNQLRKACFPKNSRRDELTSDDTHWCLSVLFWNRRPQYWSRTCHVVDACLGPWHDSKQNSKQDRDACPLVLKHRYMYRCLLYICLKYIYTCVCLSIYISSVQSLIDTILIKYTHV